MRISGYHKIKFINPIKQRKKSTLNNYQKLFHFLQRSVASKGYLEAITWSFTDKRYNDHFRGTKKEIKIINPISTELGKRAINILLNKNKNKNKNKNQPINYLAKTEIIERGSVHIVN